MGTPKDTDLLETPLAAFHRRHGAKMVAFAGYEMPIQYGSGIMEEHRHTREQAGLFDVSHMGQAYLTGDDPAFAMETLVVGDLLGLGDGRARYTLFTNESGGILDDLIVTKFGDKLFVVVNAACKDADFTHIETNIGSKTTLEVLGDRALIALQGPAAAAVLSRFNSEVADMPFMSAKSVAINGVECLVTRAGYTGEDGYEISIPDHAAADIAEALANEDEVKPIGLGARDTLRLEVGLCLYGDDIDTTTTPVEAGLTWAIGKRRRAEGGYPGADVIGDQIKNGVTRRRVGIRPQGRAPARSGTEICDDKGSIIGKVTSGGFGPSVGGPVAMGYVEIECAKPDTSVGLSVRGKILPATVVKLPFVEQHYYKG